MVLLFAVLAATVLFQAWAFATRADIGDRFAYHRFSISSVTLLPLPVWEWTNSQYLPYPYHQNDEREDPTGSARRVVRGGAWRDDQNNVSAAYRNRFTPDSRNNNLGFRVVVSVAPQ